MFCVIFKNISKLLSYKLTNFEPKKLKKNWTIEDSISTYNIDKWGDKYFSINSKGNISVTKDIKSENKIDLLSLSKNLKVEK